MVQQMIAVGMGLFLALALATGSNATTTELVEELSLPGDLFRQAALIAHVRIAGRFELTDDDGGEELWLAEIIDSVQGPRAGQLVIVGSRTGGGEKSTPYAHGQSFILFASCDPEGIHHPLPGKLSCWKIDKRGELEAHHVADSLPPYLNVHSPHDVMEWLWGEARQHDYQISVAINEDDLRVYERGKPLRLAIAIDNTGSRPLPLSNAIDVEYRSPWHGRLEGKARQSSHSPVKIYALPLSRERSLADMEKMLRESRELTLRPGERCAAEFDLSTEPMIRGGMRYQLWVEVGGRRSPSMIVDLPGDDLEFELVEKLAELEDDGPFRVVVNTVPESHGMPPVQPADDAAAVEAALAAWLDNRANESSEREIILLANANIPHDLNFGDQRYHFVSAEPIRQDAEKPRVFALRDSKALFRGRALRVEAVETGRQTATVELREESSELHGALAIVRLHRDQGAWRSSGEIMLQQYLLNC